MKKVATVGCSMAVVALVMWGWAYGARMVLAAKDAPLPPSKLLLEKVVEVPSKIAVVVRLATYPAGYKTPLHTHKGPGPRYILQGTLKVAEAGKTQTFAAGQVFWETGQPMTVENIGNAESQHLIVELLPAE